eukprot:GDKJ01065026.1.p1 GENE.GDKJ01065026.1~~GDKJ01065026.1.p1  ORF type:complete len:168 (+),score=5.94 GDKJ01065026.1:27-506(+)
MGKMDFSFSLFFTTIGLFLLSAIFEILGCYFPHLILNKNKSHWFWIPAALSLAIYSWSLTLHTTASGRTYAAYGGIYMLASLIWLRLVDNEKLTIYDLVGGLVILIGSIVIIAQPGGFSFNHALPTENQEEPPTQSSLVLVEVTDALIPTAEGIQTKFS